MVATTLPYNIVAAACNAKWKWLQIKTIYQVAKLPCDIITAA